MATQPHEFGHDNGDQIFRAIDAMAERIQQYAIEPALSQEISRRETKPSFELDDGDVLMQLYSASRGIRTGVVDLYFLIHGGQSDAQKYVTPTYYGEVRSLGG